MTTSTTELPTAADTLKAFFERAALVDGRLRVAAAAINNAGPPWDAMNYEVAAAVRAADPATVAAAVPAGLPRDLLAATILIYSDLVSRQSAMRSFASPRLWGTVSELTAELRNGHVAAQRFDADLSRARARAESLPPVTPAAANSRAGAELLLLMQYVELANGGCDTHSGQIITSLPKIEWKTPMTGSIGGIAFNAKQARRGWVVELNAC